MSAPKLPPPAQILYGYTDAQMREMWKQGIEDAAKLCDDLGAQDKLSNYHKVASLAIRHKAKEITP